MMKFCGLVAACLFLFACAVFSGEDVKSEGKTVLAEGVQVEAKAGASDNNDDEEDIEEYALNTIECRTITTSDPEIIKGVNPDYAALKKLVSSGKAEVTQYVSGAFLSSPLNVSFVKQHIFPLVGDELPELLEDTDLGLTFLCSLFDFYLPAEKITAELTYKSEKLNHNIGIPVFGKFPVISRNIFSGTPVFGIPDGRKVFFGGTCDGTSASYNFISVRREARQIITSKEPSDDIKELRLTASLYEMPLTEYLTLREKIKDDALYKAVLSSKQSRKLTFAVVDGCPDKQLNYYKTKSYKFEAYLPRESAPADEPLDTEFILSADDVECGTGLSCMIGAFPDEKTYSVNLEFKFDPFKDEWDVFDLEIDRVNVKEKVKVPFINRMCVETNVMLGKSETVLAAAIADANLNPGNVRLLFITLE